MRRTLAPLAIAALGLVGSLAVMLVLHGSATRTLDVMLEERLMAIGRSSALLLPDPPSTELLATLVRENALDGAYVVDGQRQILVDATGEAPRRADMLRVDHVRVARALQGEATVAASFVVGEVQMLTGYFPLRDRRAVLALEGGEAFTAARAAPARALITGLLLAAAGALALGAVAFAWSRAERDRRVMEARAAQAEALSRMAAVAAHEIRNPLAVIRGTVDMVRARGGVSETQGAALDDVLAEVQRLRALTDDLLDLSADRPLNVEPVELAPLLDEVARAAHAAHPAVEVEVSGADGLSLRADRTRLRQVFANLLDNAAQAQGRGAVRVIARGTGGGVEVAVRDEGGGVPADVREKIFEPFFTTRARGTGLGLALARRLVERHGGTLSLADVERGSKFVVRLPRGVEEE